MMQDNDQDTDDKYLSDLYSELSQEQPSELLDTKILSEARKEVEQQTTGTEKGSSGSSPDYSFRKKSSGPFSSWSVPVSLAAVIVLSVTVVFMIEKERPYSLTSPPEDYSSVERAMEPSGNRPMLKSIPDKEDKKPAKLAKREKSEPEKQSELKELRQIQNREVMALQQAVKPEERLQAKTKMVEADSESQAAAPESERIAKLKDDQVSRQDAASAGAGSEKGGQSEPKVALTVMPSADRESVGSIREEVVESAPSVSRKPAATVETKKESPTVASTAAVEAREEVPVETAEAPEAAESSMQAESEDDEETQVADAEQGLAASPAPVAEPAKSAAMMAAPTRKFNTFAAGSSSSEKQITENCSSLSVQACLASRECTLELDKVSGSYQCRVANSQCEKGFSQADDTQELCESRSGCKFLAANCFCPPDVECVCGGGTPSMCVPEKSE